MEELNDIDKELEESKEELLAIIIKMNKYSAQQAYKNFLNIQKGKFLSKEEMAEQKQLRFQISQIEANYRTACIRDKQNGKSNNADVAKIKEMLANAKGTMGNIVGEIPKE